jgi:hypothetical protein
MCGIPVGRGRTGSGGAHGSGELPLAPPSGTRPGRLAAPSRHPPRRESASRAPTRPSEWARRAPSRPLESRPVGPSRPCVGPTECPLGPKPPRLGHARGATRPLFCPTRPLFCPTRPLFCPTRPLFCPTRPPFWPTRPRTVFVATQISWLRCRRVARLTLPRCSRLSKFSRLEDLADFDDTKSVVSDTCIGGLSRRVHGSGQSKRWCPGASAVSFQHAWCTVWYQYEL